MDIAEFDKVVEDISDKISEGMTEEAQVKLNEVLASGVDSKHLIKSVSGKSIEKIEDAFSNNKIFLPTLVKSSEFISEIVDNEYSRCNDDDRKTVVIGTVMGDIHEIGKNLCAATLKCKGYKVLDLGCDVPPDKFIKTAINNNAQLIAVSAPMSTTKHIQKIVVDDVKTQIGDIYVLIGGAACSQKWCDDIKASGYSKDWKEFIHLVDEKIGD